MALPSNEEVQEVVDQIKEVNEFLSTALPAIVPEVEKLYDQLTPVVDKVLFKFCQGKNFDTVVVMGQAAYIARQLSADTSLTPHQVAERAVNISREILKLSREG